MFIETSIILGFKTQINIAPFFLIAIIFLGKKRYCAELSDFKFLNKKFYWK